MNDATSSNPHLINNPLIDQLRRIDKKQEQGRRVPQEAALGAAVVLLEIAACDDKVTQHEITIVHRGIEALFGCSSEETTALMNQAQNTLRGMRGSSSYAEMLKSYLDDSTKQGMAELIDQVINSDGKTEGFEIYLRNRFRQMLDIG